MIPLEAYVVIGCADTSAAFVTLPASSRFGAATYIVITGNNDVTTTATSNTNTRVRPLYVTSTAGCTVAEQIPLPHRRRYCHHLNRWFRASSPATPLSRSPRAHSLPVRQEGWRLAVRVHQVTTMLIRDLVTLSGLH